MGTPSDVSGILSASSSRKTVRVSSTLMDRPIFSPGRGRKCYTAYLRSHFKFIFMAVGLQYLFLTLDKSNNYTWLRLIKLYKDKVCSSFNWARSSILAAAGPCNSPVMTLMENSSPTQSEADWPIERGLPGVFSGHLRTVFTSDWLESLGNKKLMCIGAVRAPSVVFFPCSLHCTASPQRSTCQSPGWQAISRKYGAVLWQKMFVMDYYFNVLDFVSVSEGRVVLYVLACMSADWAGGTDLERAHKQRVKHKEEIHRRKA